jgi:hypothetical protein
VTGEIRLSSRGGLRETGRGSSEQRGTKDGDCESSNEGHSYYPLQDAHGLIHPGTVLASLTVPDSRAVLQNDRHLSNEWSNSVAEWCVIRDGRLAIDQPVTG